LTQEKYIDLCKYFWIVPDCHTTKCLKYVFKMRSRAHVSHTSLFNLRFIVIYCKFFIRTGIHTDDYNIIITHASRLSKNVKFRVAYYRRPRVIYQFIHYANESFGIFLSYGEWISSIKYHDSTMTSWVLRTNVCLQDAGKIVKRIRILFGGYR